MDLIITHSNLDFDGFSSLIAAKKLYPKAQAVLPSSLEKSVREFVLFYGEEFGFMREAECLLENIERLIIVETRFKNRLGRFANLVNNPDIEIYLYDHHPRTREDIQAKEDIGGNVGATTTLLVELVRKRNIEITPFEATALSLGIYEDTGFFSFPTTTKSDLEMAAFLLSKGADINVIARFIKRAISDEDLAILCGLISSTKLYKISGVNIGIALFGYSKYIEDLGNLANKLIDILDTDAIFVMAKIDSKVQFTARSRGSRLDVNKTMRHFDGGGHMTAASAFVKEENPEGLKEKLLKILTKQLKPKIFAADIMSYPVRTIGLKDTLREAKRLMDVYNLNGLVVKNRGKVVGVITEQDVAKAQVRGFLHSAVKGYMKQKFISVQIETPLHEIKEIMSRANSSIVPVFKEDKLAGIITRTNLMRDIHKKPALSHNKDVRQYITLNIKDRLLKSLPDRIVRRLKLIAKLSQTHNYKSFLVGGFVRDILLGVENFDIDIVIEKDTTGFARIFRDKVAGALVIYEKFGTAAVIMKDKSKVDFATAREERYDYPAALPEVEFATIQEDLSRRDFTINAMAVRLDKEHFGEVLDFFGGLEDLKKRHIRVLHKQSFIDDPTRIFRAIRFEQRYNFKIEPHTENLIKNAIEFKMFERISKQRLREELILILSEKHPLKAIKRMADLNELRFIHPSINFNKRISRLLNSCMRAVTWFEKSSNKRKLDRWLVFFMALVEDLNRKELNEVIAKFVFRKGDSKRLISSKIYSDRAVKRLCLKKEVKPSGMFRIFEELSYETIVFIVAKSGMNKYLVGRVTEFLERYNATKLRITGRDLKEMGLKPGPEFKKILRKVLFEKLDKGLRTKKEEIDFLRKFCKISI